MKMRRLKMFSFLMIFSVLVYTGCSEKEVVQPVEDTARVDALRQELRELQILIYGEELAYDKLDLENKTLNEQLAAIEAEIASLQAVYNQRVQYSVAVYDYRGEVIPGASVTINQNGEIVTKTAGDNGIATFENVRAGAVAGVVSAAGFATANYQAILWNSNDFGTVTRVPLLPKSGAQAEAGMFTLTGFLYANTNIANDTLTGRYRAPYYWNGESSFIGSNANTAAGVDPQWPNRNYDMTVANTKLRATIWFEMQKVPFSVETEPGASDNGLIRRIAYEDAAYEATYGANGQYTLKLPAFSEFMANVLYNGYGDEWETQFYFELFADNFLTDMTLVDYDVNGTHQEYYGYRNGDIFMTVPNSAYPAPKTYTAKYQQILSRGKWVDTWDFTWWDQIAPGDVYQHNLFYMPIKNY